MLDADNGARVAQGLRELERYAREGGAPPELLNAVMPTLVELLLDDVAGRRLKTLQAAARTRQLAERLQAVGYTGGDLLGAVCARLGISERTFYRHRRDCHHRGSGSVVPSGRR